MNLIDLLNGEDALERQELLEVITKLVNHSWVLPVVLDWDELMFMIIKVASIREQ